jgi:hypothetical protein
MRRVPLVRTELTIAAIALGIHFHLPKDVTAVVRAPWQPKRQRRFKDSAPRRRAGLAKVHLSRLMGSAPHCPARARGGWTRMTSWCAVFASAMWR